MSVEEDPLAQRQADRVDRPLEWSAIPDVFKPYGSIRIKHRWTGDETLLSDSGSRVGISGQYEYQPYHRLFSRLEAGVNILDELDILFNEGANAPLSHAGESLFLRLLYAGIETPNLILAAGKNWSTYYQVSRFTDRFLGTGGSATGTYNAGTDGGSTGTGRADRVLQTRILFKEFENPRLKPFNLNIQLQHGEPIPRVPDANYGTTMGVSVVGASRKDFAVGLAYNRATISDSDLPSLNLFGIDGDAQAGVLGVRWFSDKWYLATTVARLRNHETTDEDIYFDGWGSEVYGHYNVYKRCWAVAGWNILEPDTDQVQAGDYRIRYGVIGVRFEIETFAQIIYANVRLDSGRLADGTPIENSYTVGFRWNLR
jgi:predicted porin